jgi:hypothetical protein
LSLEPNQNVFHIYSRRAGRVARVDDVNAYVLWEGDDCPSSHPLRFIVEATADFKVQAGPSCGRASAGGSGGDGRNYKRRKDKSNYGTLEGIKDVEDVEEDLQQEDLQQEDLQQEDLLQEDQFDLPQETESETGIAEVYVSEEN